MASKPDVQAFLLCDQVYRDQTTRKFIIAGTFDTLVMREVGPNVFFNSPSSCYIHLRELNGSYELQLRYVSLKENTVLVESPKVPIQHKDPLAGFEMGIRVPHLPTPHYGVYAFEVHINDEYVRSVRIKVQPPEGESGG